MFANFKSFGVGVNDVAGSSKTAVYVVWYSMLRRCYSSVYHKNKPAYVGASVVEEWHKLSVFAEWFARNYKSGYELDKDILVKGNNVYGPATCCFVPPEINAALIANKSKTELPIGVYYKKANRQYCASLAMGSDSNGKRINAYLGLYQTPLLAFAAYKKAKESWLKELADKYKDSLDPRVYDALLSYSVEATD